MSSTAAARLRRSCLAVPASNPGMIEKAAASQADQVFIDLEDACAPGEKVAARTLVVRALTTLDFAGKLRVVRINAVGSPGATATWPSSSPARAPRSTACSCRRSRTPRTSTSSTTSSPAWMAEKLVAAGRAAGLRRPA